MTKILRDFSEMENARVEMEVAFMTKTGLPEELEKINKIVEDLGIKLPGSATDFYRVATALKATGMSARDIAEGALKGASYAWVLFKREVSPEQAAEYMQEFANAFKIPANQFMEFVDQLQRVKFASGLTLSEIAYSTKYFSSELNQLGITGIKAFNLMGAWIGTLKQFGIKGETAGTSIRSLLQNIVKLDEHVARLSRQGIDLHISARDFVDEKGAFRLEEFLITIRDRLNAIQDPLQRMQAMRTLFDTEGMRAIAPLLARTKDEAIAYLSAIKDTLSPEEYTRLREQIEKGGFSGLEEMAKKMQEQASLQDRINRTLSTFANIWESLQGTIAQFGAVVGELVAPTLKVLMDTLNTFIGKLADFINEHKTISKVLAHTVGGFVGFLAVLGAVGLVLGSMIKLFAFAFSPFVWILRANLVRGLTSALFQNALAFIKWAATGTASTGWLKALDFFLLKAKFSMLQLIGVIKLKILALRAMAIAWLTSPIGLIIAGISALIAIIENSVAFFKWAITGNASKEWLKKLDFLLLKLKYSFYEVISAIKQKIVAMFSWIKAKILAVNWSLILRNTLLFLKTAFFNVIAVIRAFTITLFTTPVGWFLLGMTAIIGVGYLLYKNWDRIVKWLSSALNWLKENWKKLAHTILFMNPFTAVIITINNFVRKVFGINLFEAGKKIITTFTEGIKSVASKPVEAMKSIVQKIRNFLPFSPAKEGPLRDIHRIKLIETIAEGIKPEPILDRIKQTVEKVKTIIPPPIPHPSITHTFTHTPHTQRAHIVINLGGITISGTAGQKEIDNLATELEKRIKSVMERIINDTNRRRY